MSELTHDDVQKILEIIDRMGDRDIHLEIGDLKLHVTRVDDQHHPGYTASAPASPQRSSRMVGEWFRRTRRGSCASGT